MKIKTFDEADKALLELGQIETILTKKEASMNSKIQTIKEEYAEATREEQTQKEEITAAIDVFCLENSKEFDKVRSKKLIHGTLSVRTNPSKIVQLNKKWSVKSSLEFLKKLFEGKYVRLKEEIDKASILADYAAKDDKGNQIMDDQKLAAVGLRVEQDETWSYDINWESIQSNVTKFAS